MSNITNQSITCSLQARVYSPGYLFFKLLNATYLRGLIGPSILLNILCLIVLSRPRLSRKSTTIVFLRFLAIFDMLSIILKYIRAEINYQSIEKNHEVFLLIPSVCKTLYVFMNASISIAMWIIVLMSIDKAVAVSYPLKSSIWMTCKRAYYICFGTIITLFVINLSFINFSGILVARNHHKYCGLNEKSFIIDLLAASILPMSLIIAANIVISVVLHRVSRTSLTEKTGDDNECRYSDGNSVKQYGSIASAHYRFSEGASFTPNDAALAAKRRTSAQVTRMLLAVTLSLIICNIPNTILFIVVQFYDTRQLLIGRSCADVSDHDINLYKFGFYSSVIQDILSDLPHMFNFFLYCMAGKKFRSVFMNEVRQLCVDLRLMKKTDNRFMRGSSILKADTFRTSRDHMNRHMMFSKGLFSRKDGNCLKSPNEKQSLMVNNQRKNLVLTEIGSSEVSKLTKESAISQANTQ